MEWGFIGFFYRKTSEIKGRGVRSVIELLQHLKRFLIASYIKLLGFVIFNESFANMNQFVQTLESVCWIHWGSIHPSRDCQFMETSILLSGPLRAIHFCKKSCKRTLILQMQGWQYITIYSLFVIICTRNLVNVLPNSL